jgi:hypothetical protein
MVQPDVGRRYFAKPIAESSGASRSVRKVPGELVPPGPTGAFGGC